MLFDYAIRSWAYAYWRFILTARSCFKTSPAKALQFLFIKDKMDLSKFKLFHLSIGKFQFSEAADEKHQLRQVKKNFTNSQYTR